MLETVREFALEQLAASGEEPAVRARHAAWCLALAEAAGRDLHYGQAEAAWLARPGRRSWTTCALRWPGSTHAGDAISVLRLVSGIEEFLVDPTLPRRGPRLAAAGPARHC